MILARWLSYPPDRYEEIAGSVLDSDIYHKMKNQIEVIELGQALVPENFKLPPIRSFSSKNVFSEIVLGNHQYHIVYCHFAWGKEYLVDGQPPIEGDENDAERDWLLRRLRLINTRNRLTHLVLRSVINKQASFLSSGQYANMQRFTISDLYGFLAFNSSWLTKQVAPGHPPEVFDISMFSRLIRGLVVCLPNGDQVPLRKLIPSGQKILHYKLLTLLEEESDELKRGNRQRPQKDNELQEEIQTRWDLEYSRRAVADARQKLGIQNWRQRTGRPIYPPTTHKFSTYYSLTNKDIRTNIPISSGVYEISLSDDSISYPYRPSSVIYIGRSQNLKIRIRSHLYNQVKFGKDFLDKPLLFRFSTIQEDHLDQAEANLIQAFENTFGQLPKFNANKPSGRKKT